VGKVDLMVITDLQSRRDNEQSRITQLVERIKQDFAPFAKRELVPFFDQQEIGGMQDWRQRILQGLRESRLLLTCLSPAYLKSEYCEWEFVEYLRYAHAFADEYGGGRWQVRCAGKDDLRLALAELATPIGFEFTDDEKKNADLQFDRTRRELKKLADAGAPHRCRRLRDNVGPLNRIAVLVGPDRMTA
jgi:hypothetical protein